MGVNGSGKKPPKAVVVGGCGCGCPSIDFYKGQGMDIHVNAAVEGRPFDGFLYSLGGRLGGIEWVGASEEADPPELPHPSMLKITPASEA